VTITQRRDGEVNADTACGFTAADRAHAGEHQESGEATDADWVITGLRLRSRPCPSLVTTGSRRRPQPGSSAYSFTPCTG
jgi:hypothetical protein